MAHAIPKIQYRISSLQGNTASASPVLTAFADTGQVAVGMYATGTGIPAGAKVLSKTSSTVTLDKDATANGTAVAFEFGFDLEFEFPPVEDGGETLEPNEKSSTSLNGTVQVGTNFIERQRAFQFRHISQAVKEAVETFMGDWASWGQPFRYFDDKTLSSFIVYELDDRKFRPKKITPKGTGYVWEFPLTVRRVFDSVLEEVTAMQSFTPIRPSAYPHTIVKNTLVLVDTSSPRSLQFPEPAAGLTFRVKDAVGSANANNISCLRYGGEEIETVAATKLLSTNFGAWEFTSDGVDWFITSF